MTNSKLTKRALLSSVMALILCFTMLLGTTFAWFTDTASTSVNKIEAGTLDIQLLDASGNSLEGKTLSWQKAAGHEDDDVLWEPGCTYSLQPITIKNNGSLALKYKIVITGIDGDAELNEVIDWTLEVKDSEDNAITSELTADHSLAVGESNTLTISGHMKENAGNGYQGISIDGIAIAVLATQDTVEYDSFNKTYDENAEFDKYAAVKTRDEALNAIKAGNTIINIVDDITVKNDNGHNNNLFFSGDTGSTASDVILTGTGTVKSIFDPENYNSETRAGGIYTIWALNGMTLTITGGTYIAEGNNSNDMHHLIYVNNNATVIVKGGTFIKKFDQGYPLNVSFNNDGAGDIIIKGGLFNFDPSEVGKAFRQEDAYDFSEHPGHGIRIAEGYKVVTKDINGETWYEVVAE